MRPVIVPGAGRPVAAEVARHYDDLDRYYLELWGEHVHHGLWETGTEAPGTAVETLVRRVAAEAGVEPGSRVCDVGCGYGGTARLLAREYGARVSGVTLSRSHGAYARDALRREGLGERVRIHVGDWLGGAFAEVRSDGPFEVVLAVESMTHMEDLTEALARVRAILSPGGRFVACVWLAGEPLRPFEIRHLLAPICREGRLAGLPSAGEFVSAMEGAGLVRTRLVADLSSRVRQTWDWTLKAAVRRLVSDPEARRFLRDPGQPERVFAVTMLRILAAYRTGALRYGLFRGDVPD